eukprot:s3488_g12.t1
MRSREFHQIAGRAGRSPREMSMWFAVVWPFKADLWRLAWRYPCYTITDLQIYEAVLPPEFVAVADNAITYSDKGHGNTLMAGGDLDGDHVMVCFWRKFVAIMERMQPSVARLEALLKLYEQDVLEAVVSRRTAWASAAVQQRGHSLKTFDLARQQPPPVGYPPSARQQPPPVGYPPSACQELVKFASMASSYNARGHICACTSASLLWLLNQAA